MYNSCNQNIFIMKKEIEDVLDKLNKLEAEYQEALWVRVERFLQQEVDKTAKSFNSQFESKDNSLEGYNTFFQHYSESLYKIQYRWKILKQLHNNIINLNEMRDEKMGKGALMQLENMAETIESLLLRGKIRRQSTDLIINHSHLLEREADQIILSDLRYWVKVVKHETEVYQYEIDGLRNEIRNITTN
jgi:hypothetical protein